MTDDRALQETCISRLGEQDNHEGKAQCLSRLWKRDLREGSSGEELLRDLSSLGNSDFLNVYIERQRLGPETRAGTSGL